MASETLAPPAVEPATRLPGPPELLPGRPDAVIDLQTDAGAALVGAQWRWSDAAVREIDFVAVGGAGAADPLGPGDAPNRTYDVVPHAGGAGFDDAGWERLAPADTMRRLSTGRVCFCWYRVEVTIPDRVGALDPTGATVVFEVVVDDYAEVWVNGALPHALGDSGGPVAAGFNAPNRVVLTRDARPGDRFVIAVFGINGPISAAPANYIWMRTATLDVYARERATPARAAALAVDRFAPALDAIVAPGARLEQVAGGFEFTEGPVWSPDGALLFSSPNTDAIYRWDPVGKVTVFRAKSGYTGTDIGRYHQPGSNGLTFDPAGRLTICQHGNRRVVRVEPHGDVTVVADAYEGRRLNSPNDVVCRSDGAVFFTDPPFGLPGVFDDPAKELPFSGVFCARDGDVTLVSDELAGPNGLAFAPGECFLYVGNWPTDPDDRKWIVRYAVGADGTAGSGELLCDLTDEPGEDAIDGLKVDAAGNVYACGPGGVWVISPAGERLGLLRLPESPHNLAWGEPDRRTLYVTALTGVYRIRLGIPGLRSW
ncbi:MAG: SMP-30/gluconolactonase/LRE family protein [Solirubrobacteraceae bacterium]